MFLSQLSDSSQNYLKAVWSLSEWSDAPVTASVVAKRVGVRLSSASDAIRKLTEQGLIEHSLYGDVKLSTEGERLALEVVRRHRLIETFLVTVLGYTWDQVHDEAEKLEHSISDFMTSRIDSFLGFPDRDPHGDPIPSAEGTYVRPRAFPLSLMLSHRRLRVERISDDNPQLLQFFANQGILFGSILEVVPAPHFSDTIEVHVEGEQNSTYLGKAAAESLWVSSLD